MKKPARLALQSPLLGARFQGGKRRLLSQGLQCCGGARAGNRTVRLDHGRAPAAVAGLTFHNHTCHGRDTHEKHNQHEPGRRHVGNVKRADHRRAPVRVWHSLRIHDGVARGPGADRRAEHQRCSLSGVLCDGEAACCTLLVVGLPTSIGPSRVIWPFRLIDADVTVKPPSSRTSMFRKPVKVAAAGSGFASSTSELNAAIKDSASDAGSMFPCAPERTDARMASLIRARSSAVSAAACAVAASAMANPLLRLGLGRTVRADQLGPDRPNRLKTGVFCFASLNLDQSGKRRACLGCQRDKLSARHRGQLCSHVNCRRDLWVHAADRTACGTEASTGYGTPFDTFAP